MAENVDLRIVVSAVDETRKVLQNLTNELNAVQRALGRVNGENEGPLQNLGKEVGKIGQNAAETASRTVDMAAGLTRITGLANGLATAFKFVTGGVLSFGFLSIAKNVADTAARAEVLGTILNTIARNAGITEARINSADREIQKLGITAESSRQSLTQLIQAGLSLDLAPKLARAAQDLAVVSGMNSSETLSRMVVNIQQMDSLGLRWMGIMINREQAFARAEAMLGKALDNSLKQQVFANAVLEESVKLAGIYEASMENVSKMLSTQPRLYTELKTAIGGSLLPIYTEIVRGTNDFLKALTQLFDGTTSGTKQFNVFGEEVKKTSSLVTSISSVISGFYSVLIAATNALGGFIAAWEKLNEFLPVTEAAFALIALSVGKLVMGLKVMAPVLALLKGAWALLTGGFAAASAAGGAFTLAVLIPIALIAAKVIGAILLLAGAFKLVTSAWDFLNSRFVNSGGNAERVVARYKAASSKAREVAEEMAEAVRALGDVEVKIKSGTVTGEEYKRLVEQRDRLNADIERLKKEQEKANKDLQKARKDAAYVDPKSQAGDDLKNFNEREAEAKRVADAAKKAEQNAIEAMDKLGFLMYRGADNRWVVATKSIKESFGTISESLQGLTKDSNEAGIAFNNLFATMLEGAAKAATNTDWANVEKLKQQFRDKARELNQSITDDQINTSVQGALDFAARQQARQFADNLRGGAGPAAEQRALENAKTDAVKSDALARNQIVRSELQVQRTIIQAARDEQTISEQEYFRRMREVRRKERAADLSDISIQRRAIQAQLNSDAFVGKPAQRVQAEAELNQLNLRAQVILNEAKKDGLEIDQQQLQAAKARSESIRSEALKAAERIDAEAAAVARVNVEYAEKARLAGDNKVEQQLIEANRVAEVERILLENALKRRDLEADVLAITEGLNASIEKIRIKYARIREENKGRPQAVQDDINTLESSEIAKVIREEKTKIRDLDIEIKRITDSQGAEIDAINARYDDQLVTMINIEGAADRINKLRADAIRKQREKETTAALERELALDESRLAIMQAQVNLARSRGQITTLQAQDARNELTLQRMDNVAKRIASTRERLSRQISLGVDPQEISATETLLNNLTQQLIELSTQVRTLGDEFRDAFQQGLDQYLKDIILRTESASEAWKKFRKSIADTLLGTATKNLSELFTGVISRAGADENGQGGLFDTFASFFKVGKTDDILARSRREPMYIIPHPSAMSLFQGASSGSAPSGGGLFGFISRLFGGNPAQGNVINWDLGFAEGGRVVGPGTGTSDSIPAMVSAGEHIMPAEKTKKWLPLLEGIRLGLITDSASLLKLVANVPKFAAGGVVSMPELPRSSVLRFAEGGVVPSVATRGGDSFQIGVNIDGGAVRSGPGGAVPDNNVAKFGDMIGAMVQRQIVAEKRPGGLLYGRG